MGNADIQLQVPATFSQDETRAVQEALEQWFGVTVTEARPSLYKESLHEQPIVNIVLVLGPDALKAFAEGAIRAAGEAAYGAAAPLLSRFVQHIRNRFRNARYAGFEIRTENQHGKHLGYVLDEYLPDKAFEAMVYDFEAEDDRIAGPRHYVDEGWLTWEEDIERRERIAEHARSSADAR
jgi:hypothetical protein